MKRLLIILILCAQAIVARSQNIIAAEYFIDADPGPGNGISISIPVPSDTVSFSVAIPASLPAGFHFLAIRIKDVNGLWSLFERRGFYINPAAVTSPNIVAAEYFVDTDPGQGNGVNITLPAPSDTVSFSVAIPASLPAGFHFLSIRIKDANGKWSLFERRGFYVNPAAIDQPNIVAAEYFINTDPGVGNGIAINIPAPVATYIESLTLSPGNLPLGNYQIAIRVKNTNGQWGLVENKPFSVCSTYGAQSEMDYQVEGNRVFFTNNSLYYDTVTWKFGDNTLDTVLHPVKTYSTAGVYQVQLITGNSCGIDTLTTPIEIRGLQRVNPGKAGNAGISTLMFEGFGFTASTNVKLIQGTQVYTPAVKYFLNGNRIRSQFNLTGFAPGVYSAVATIGSAFDTLHQALTIEQGTPADITLDISNSAQTTRPGRARSIGLIKNNGNQDAIMVPYFAGLNILPGTTAVNMNAMPSSPMANLQNAGIFQHTLQYLSTNGVPPEVMHASNKDSARNRHIIAYYRTRIPGHSSSQEIITNPHSLGPHSFQLGAVVGAPLLDSYALLDSINSEYQACYSAFLKHEIEKQLNITLNNSGWNSCFIPAFDTLMKTLANICQDPALEYYGVPMQAGMSALLAKMADCGGSGIPAGLGGITFKRIIQGVMNNWIYLEDVDSLDPDCIDTTIQVFSRMISNNTMNTQLSSGRSITGGCSDCPGAAVFPEMCDQCLPLLIAGKVGKKLKMSKRAFGANSAIQGCQDWCETTSIDPNAKYGPGNNEDRKYINHYKEVSYKITFENLATATAPAAYVEIRDTIDKTVFDILSLKLGVLSWGDSLLTLEPNEQNISILKDIRPTHPNFLRIDVKTDTAAGVVVWRFWTVDTVTLQLTANPSEGFLPPNTDGKSGAGYVSYSIAPKLTVANGSFLENRASIVFDNNAALLTNIWEYGIDTLQPSSAVNSLPAITPTASFPVSWSGSDAHAGIDLYSVYVSINDSAYRVWQSLTALTSATYTGQYGKTYKFFSVALDKAGNYEDPPVNPLQNPDAVTTIQGPLPLELLSFEARKSTDGQKIELHWKTAHEFNVSHFDLQRSPDGISYSSLANINARNNPAGAEYSWMDDNAFSGMNFYRLRIIDMDATFVYSPVRSIRFERNALIQVFPSITHDLIYIKTNKQITVELFNVVGVRLATKIIGREGSFDLRKFGNGIYFLRIQNHHVVYRIIKQ